MKDSSCIAQHGERLSQRDEKQLSEEKLQAFQIEEVAHGKPQG